MDTQQEVKPPNPLNDVIISPFNQNRLYRLFDDHSFHKSNQVIAMLKKQCEEDPTGFMIAYGEEMACILIEAKWD